MDTTYWWIDVDGIITEVGYSEYVAWCVEQEKKYNNVGAMHTCPID